MSNAKGARRSHVIVAIVGAALLAVIAVTFVAPNRAHAACGPVAGNPNAPCCDQLEESPDPPCQPDSHPFPIGAIFLGVVAAGFLVLAIAGRRAYKAMRSTPTVRPDY